MGEADRGEDGEYTGGSGRYVILTFLKRARAAAALSGTLPGLTCNFIACACSRRLTSGVVTPVVILLKPKPRKSSGTDDDRNLAPVCVMGCTLVAHTMLRLDNMCQDGKRYICRGV